MITDSCTLFFTVFTNPFQSLKSFRNSYIFLHLTVTSCLAIIYLSWWVTRCDQQMFKKASNWLLTDGLNGLCIVKLIYLFIILVSFDSEKELHWLTINLYAYLFTSYFALINHKGDKFKSINLYWVGLAVSCFMLW